MQSKSNQNIIHKKSDEHINTPRRRSSSSSHFESLQRCCTCCFSSKHATKKSSIHQKDSSVNHHFSFRTVITLVFIFIYVVGIALTLYFVFSGALDSIYPSIEYLLGQTTNVLHNDLSAVFGRYKNQGASVKNWTRRNGLPLANEINRYQYTSLTLGQFLHNPQTSANFRQFVDGSMQASAINNRYSFIVTDTQPKAIWDWTIPSAPGQAVSRWVNSTFFVVDPLDNYTGFLDASNITLNP